MDKFFRAVFDGREVPPDQISEYKVAFLKAYLGEHETVLRVDEIKQCLKRFCPTDFINIKPLLHCGISIPQRRIFLGVLGFLTRRVGTKRAIVVCCGMAPHNAFGFLSDLFPEVSFILIDERPSNISFYGDINPDRITVIKSNGACGGVTAADEAITAAVKSPGVYLIHDNMNDEIAKRLCGDIQHPLYWASNLPVINSESRSISLLSHMANNYKWTKMMRDSGNLKRALLEFSFHEYDASTESLTAKVGATAGIDFASDYSAGVIRYWKGTPYLQQFAEGMSESFWLDTDMLSEAVFDCEFRGRLLGSLRYWNMIERWLSIHPNPSSDRKLGFCRCGDCAGEYALWSKYSEVTGEKVPILDYVARLSTITRHGLISSGHGMLYAKYSPENLILMAKASNETPFDPKKYHRVLCRMLECSECKG